MEAIFYSSEGEMEMVNRIYDLVGCSRPESIGGEILAELFTNSFSLPTSVLGQIWNIADEGQVGTLSERGLAKAIRLIGWAQKGAKVDLDLLTSDVSEWMTPKVLSEDPFKKLFEDKGPVNGLLPGEVVKDIFLESKLPPHDLWKIWNLVDTQKRGSLELGEFAYAMHIIRAITEGKLSSIPDSVPDHIQQQIYGATIGRDPVISTTPMRKKSLSSLESISYGGWDITSSERTAANREFNVLDTSRVGYIDGDTLGRFMLSSKLPHEDLAHIWDLANVNNDNRFTREAFVIALHLIRRRLSGKELPILPPSSMSLAKKREPVQADFASTINASTSSPFHLPPHLSPKPPSVVQPEPLGKFSSELTTFDQLEPSLQIDRSSSKQPLFPVPKIALDAYKDLEREKSKLTTERDELLTQLGNYHRLLAEHHELQDERTSFIGKIQHLEHTMSQFQQTTERLPVIENENTYLRTQVTDLKKLRAQVEEKQKRISTVIEQNGELNMLVLGAEEAAKVAKERSTKKLETMTRKIESLEEQNESLRSRVLVMERALIPLESSSGSAASVHELQILLADLSEENQKVKRRLRKTEKSLGQLEMASSTADSLNDDLCRQNVRLATELQDLEKASIQLQNSNQNDTLQIIVAEITQENDRLKSRIRVMEDEELRLRRTGADRIQELERELAVLKEEARQLRLQPVIATDPLVETSEPPPAYDEA